MSNKADQNSQIELCLLLFIACRDLYRAKPEKLS